MYNFSHAMDIICTNLRKEGFLRMSQGKHLPSILVKHHKNTAGRETEVMPIPDVVEICMSQSIGAPCQPLVAKGDYVKVGQKMVTQKLSLVLLFIPAYLEQLLISHRYVLRWAEWRHI